MFILSLQRICIWFKIVKWGLNPYVNIHSSYKNHPWGTWRHIYLVNSKNQCILNFYILRLQHTGIVVRINTLTNRLSNGKFNMQNNHSIARFNNLPFLNTRIKFPIFFEIKGVARFYAINRVIYLNQCIYSLSTNSLLYDVYRIILYWFVIL